MLNRLRLILDSSLTVSNCLEKSIAAYGADAEILRFSGDQTALGIEGQCLTLEQLQQSVNRISNMLMQLGVRRFDRVAIYKRGAVDYLILSLAIIRAGGITVPINGDLSRDNVRRYLQHTGARLVFVDGTTLTALDPNELAGGTRVALVLDQVDRDQVGIVRVKELISAASTYFEPVTIDHHDNVMIVHTSGTTGFPKGVAHVSDSIIRATKSQLMLQPFTRRNRALLCSPANHHITQAGIFTCLASGVPAYVPSGEDASTLLRLIEREHCTLVLAFPDVYRSICALPIENYQLGHVKAWMAGGDSSYEVHIRKLTSLGAFLKIFGKPLIRSAYIEFLGTSEVGFAALLKISYSFTNRYGRCVGRRTLGSPRVKIVDENGHKVAVGIAGRLMVKGPTVFKKYWNAADDGQNVFTDGWWWTGDIARRDRVGRYYHLDREIDVIRHAQREIYTLPLQEKLLHHPQIFAVAVVAMGDAADAVGAIIEPKADETLTAAALDVWAKSTLNLKHAIQFHVLPVGEKLPRGLTGKVLKQKVRENFSHQLSAPSTSFVTESPLFQATA